MTRLCTCADAEAVATRAAREIAQHLARAREQRGGAHLALSGGSTPARTYELLAESLSDWDGVDVWFADERCVGPQDEQSNYRMADETLLSRVSIAPERIHRMQGELGPERGAARYAQALARLGGDASSIEANSSPSEQPGLPIFDVIVLGIGPDGHVASLFPDAATLDAGEQAICLAVHDSPKPPPQRITLSLAVLRAARRCLLLATGGAKRDAITAALAEPTRDLPASLLRRERLSVILDDDASPSPPPG